MVLLRDLRPQDQFYYGVTITLNSLSMVRMPHASNDSVAHNTWNSVPYATFLSTFQQPGKHSI